MMGDAIFAAIGVTCRNNGYFYQSLGGLPVSRSAREFPLPEHFQANQSSLSVISRPRHLMCPCKRKFST